MMRKILACVALVATVGVAGCGYTPEQRAASGGLIGAGTGASLAALAGGGPGAVIAGSLIGAGTGAVVGAATTPPPPPPPGAYPPPPGEYPPPPGPVPPVVVAGGPPVVVVGPRRRCVEWRADIYGRRFCRVRV